jgi:hypothetical protein
MRGPARILVRAFRLVLWAAAIIAGLAIGDAIFDVAGVKWWILRTVYSDVPRLEFATTLEKPLVFRARILDKRQYMLNLLVHYDNREQRVALQQILGKWGDNEQTSADSGIRTQFRIVVRDDGDRIIRDETPGSIGWHGTREGSLDRRIDAFTLSSGIYFIEVTPVGDLSAFRNFRTSVELTTHPKATAIRD